jgi:hypothetical protein
MIGTPCLMVLVRCKTPSIKETQFVSFAMYGSTYTEESERIYETLRASLNIRTNVSYFLRLLLVWH